MDQQCCTAQAGKSEHKPAGRRVYQPRVDIAETAEAFTFTAEMPGTSPEGISVTYENGTLALYGAVEPRRPESAQQIVREYEIGDYSRTFQIRENVDAAAVTAEYRDGMLFVTVPKAAAAKPRRIDVKHSTDALN